jgi:Na+-translocating ferredoxin:NAD+ oxidoreductase subunit G
MKNAIKLPLILAAYTVVACVALAFIYQVTAPLIAETAANEVKAGLTVVFPAASDFEDVTGSLESGSAAITFDKAYVAKKGDAAVGMVVQVTGPTYSSSTILVGVDMDRAITQVKFMANADTPGLGSKTAEEPFVGQFNGKSVDDAFAVKKDVAAVSGATISSKGVAAMLKLAGYKAGEYLAEKYGAKAGTGSAPVVADFAPMPVDAALAELFPGATFESIGTAIANTVEKSVVITESWLAKKDGKAVGVAVQAKGQTYKASTVLVGVNMNRTLAGLRVNATSDSKNYGLGMLDPDFYLMFDGKGVDDAFLVKTASASGDVDSITGATISTMGLSNMAKIAAFEGAAYLASKHGGKAAPSGAGAFALNVIPEEE